jgi:hypothetical protein
MDGSFRLPSFLANPATGDSQKTVIVLGAFRGGTSMVSRLLRELGVFMGEKFAVGDGDYDNAEDKEFQDLLHRPDLLTKENVDATDFSSTELRQVQDLIAKRNQQHSLWGWKYPGTVLWCLHAGLSRYLRNPHFITVFRDPLAIFQHELDKRCLEAADIHKESGRSFRWIGLQNQRLVEHVVRSSSPHLLISYERTMTGDARERQILVKSLIRFLHPALSNPPQIEPLRKWTVHEAHAASPRQEYRTRHGANNRFNAPALRSTSD